MWEMHGTMTTIWTLTNIGGWGSGRMAGRDEGRGRVCVCVCVKKTMMMKGVASHRKFQLTALLLLEFNEGHPKKQDESVVFSARNCRI